MPTIFLGSPKKRDRTVNKQALQLIYQSRRWKRIRAIKIINNPLCEDCLREGKTTQVQEVHHIIPIEVRPDLAFDYDNLMSLCVVHHKKRDRK
jgi:5-methylcytosine-specific restriction protein A